MSELIMGPGLVHKLFKALRRTGGTDTHVDEIANEKLLRQLLAVVDGKAVVKLELPVIDCSVKVDGHLEPPFFQIDLGLQIWDKEKMETSLFQAEGQKNGLWLDHLDVFTLLEPIKKRMFNECPIPFLLANEYLIPRSWRGKKIHFPNTVHGAAIVGRRTHAILEYFSAWHLCFHDHSVRYGKDDFIALIPE